MGKCAGRGVGVSSRFFVHYKGKNVTHGAGSSPGTTLVDQDRRLKLRSLLGGDRPHSVSVTPGVPVGKIVEPQDKFRLSCCSFSPYPPEGSGSGRWVHWNRFGEQDPCPYVDDSPVTYNERDLWGLKVSYPP